MEVMMSDVVNLAQKFALFQEHWSPKVVGELNENHILTVKLKGEFVWHKHDDDDEFFLVMKGRLVIRLRDRDLTLNEGEFVVIPKGVEHQPFAEDEVHAVLIERKTVVNTGDVSEGRTVTPDQMQRI
jgi:mannose-6-phosphate isomerase-like protein (cupin superfamily)